jgi:hypothetical protein
MFILSISTAKRIWALILYLCIMYYLFSMFIFQEQGLVTELTLGD